MNAEVNENLQSSALVQRLRQRVVESPGVINLRQLPAQRTQSAANTIIQRYNLSDRIQSRYNSAPIFQPTGIAHLFQRSRAEAFSTLDTPLSSPSVRGNGELGIGNWELGIGNEGTSPPHPVTFSPSPGTFRVSRRLSSETTASNFESSLTETGSSSLSTQNSGDISPSDAMLVSPSVADAIAASPPALESPSERVRVQHPSRSNTSIQRVSIPQSDRADTPMGTSDNSIQSQSSLDLPLQRVSLPNRTTQPNAAIGTASNTTSEAITTPITLIQHQSQPTSIARVTQHLESNASVRSHSAPPENIASGQSVIPKPINSMPLVVARVPLNQETTQTSDTLSTQEQAFRQTISPLPLRVPATSSSSLGLQRQSQEGTAVTFGSAQTNAQNVGYVNTTESRSHQPPVSATDSASRSVLQNIPAASQPEMVWRKPSAESIPSALPVGETSSNSAIIARQTLLEASPALESVPPTSTTTTTSTAETAASGNTNTVDIQQIAEQVSRILTRQLTVERERRGMGRW
ncbi:MAG: hypothetical protein Fur006_37710 [Coleofasciculaceae cyanobacterium]